VIPPAIELEELKKKIASLFTFPLLSLLKLRRPYKEEISMSPVSSSVPVIVGVAIVGEVSVLLVRV
jgi:hypothetical protein